MAVTSWKNAGTVINSARAQANAWSNPTWVITSNNQRATATLPKNEVSDYIRCTLFLFGNDIPVGSIIDGIEITVERNASNSAITDDTVQLRKLSGSVGDNKASASGWSDLDSVITYGGSTDKWGTTWTRDDIINSNFGIDFAASNTSTTLSSLIPRVDHIRIRIYYTETGPDFSKIKQNIGGTWKDVSDMKINIGGTWKDVASIKQNIGGTWKDVL